MSSRSFRLSALSVALLSASQGWAIGFGDIILHSRIGEPLRAEVPITADASEQLETTCFTLAPMNGSDLPVISNAKTKLVRDGDRFRLLITGSKPVSEPIFLIGLRAGCGIDLQRDFVLMPAEPLALATLAPSGGSATAAPSAPAARGAKGAGQEIRASEGDTLESIAESLVPNNLAQQRRMLAALRRANPQLSGRPALPDGTLVAVPDVKQRISAERDSVPAQQERPVSEPPPLPKVAKPVATPKPSTGDRVLLGAPPAEIKPGEKAAPPKGSKEEFDERMARMEATIQLLNTQIEALDKALALTTETLVLRQKLQAAEAASGALPGPVAKPAEPPPPSSDSNWLEILLSALAGGLIAGGLAHYLGRRREQRMEPGRPLAVPREPDILHREPAIAQKSPAVANATAASTAPQALDIPLEPFSRAPEDAKQIDVQFNQDESAIALAEIMLSFGRPQGAAETLARHIEESESDNPRPWLMLLDLYRRSGLKGEYTGLLPALRRKFNVQAPAWEELQAPASGLKSLEDYEHIVARVTATWGTQEGMDTLYRLVHDNRDGQRSGFPLEVVEEIVLLLLVLETGYGLQRQR